MKVLGHARKDDSDPMGRYIVYRHRVSHKQWRGQLILGERVFDACGRFVASLQQESN